MRNEKLGSGTDERKNVKYDLEERLIDFACLCLDVCDLLPNSRAGQNLEYQLSKSSTAAALNYGEAQAAESRADFLHKMKVVLKEIRESGVNLKIVQKKQMVMDPIIEVAVKEADELRAIFIKSVQTATNNKTPLGRKTGTQAEFKN